MLQSRPLPGLIGVCAGALIGTLALSQAFVRIAWAQDAQAPEIQAPGSPAPEIQAPATQGPGGSMPEPQIAATPGVPDVFTVSGIEVDATSSDAVTARDQAILEGQQAGLDRLLRRLVPARDYARLPPASSLPIDDYVQSFEIANEELSSTRYIAQMTVAYDPSAVRDLLRRGGFAGAETASMPVVVLPLYETEQGARLWPDDNPWWQAWAEHMDPEQLLRLVLPLGDLEDITTVSVAQAQAGDPVALGNLATRYGAESTLVVSATAIGGASPEEVRAVRLDARRSGEVPQQGQPLTLTVGPDQPLEQVLAEAVERTQASLDEQWKSANLLRFDQGGTMLAGVPIARLADWVAVKRGLERLPEVSEITITSFARDQVGLEIRYIGDQFRLEQALAQLGLALTREGDSWLLLPTGGNPSQGGQPSATSTAF
jgi:hypothetical protein